MALPTFRYSVFRSVWIASLLSNYGPDPISQHLHTRRSPPDPHPQLAFRSALDWRAATSSESGSAAPARLLPDRQDDAKACLAAHHAVVGLGDALQRIGLVHRPHAGPHAEGERVLRVDRGPGIPALDRAAPHEQRHGRHLHRLGRPDDQQRAVDRQAALDGAHRLAAGRRRQDDLGAAQLEEFRRGVLGLAVDVDRRAQLAGERLLVLPAGDADRVKAHLRGVLDAEVAEPAQPEHGDDVARPRAAVAQRVERGQAGAHQRGRLDGRQVGGHQRDRAGGGDQVLAVAAVIGDAGDLAAHAGEELPAAAVVAIAAVAAVPPDADPLARLPSGDAGADRVDHPGHLMAGDPRVLNSREEPLLGDRIAVADAAGLHLDPHRSGARLRDRPFNDLKGPIRAGDLHDTHRRHGSSCCLPSAPAASKSCSPSERLEQCPLLQH